MKKEQATEKGSGGGRDAETEGEGESYRTWKRKGGGERQKREGKREGEEDEGGGKYGGYVGTEQGIEGETERDTMQHFLLGNFEMMRQHVVFC